MKPHSFKQTLLDIKDRIKSVWYDQLNPTNLYSKDFGRGFRHCYLLFETAFKADKSLDMMVEHYNSHLLNAKLDKALRLLQEQRDRNKELWKLNQTSNLMVKKEGTMVHLVNSLTKDISKLGEITKEDLKEIVNNRVHEIIKTHN